MKIGDCVETRRLIQFFPRIGCRPFNNCLVGDPSPHGVGTRCEVVQNGAPSGRYLPRFLVKVLDMEDGYLAWVSPEDVEPVLVPAVVNGRDFGQDANGRTFYRGSRQTLPRSASGDMGQTLGALAMDEEGQG